MVVDDEWRMTVAGAAPKHQHSPAHELTEETEVACRIPARRFLHAFHLETRAARIRMVETVSIFARNAP